MNIEFDEWRQNVTHEDGTVTKDVLFVRARQGNVEYHTVVWDEKLIDDAKEMLTLYVHDHD